MKRWLILLSLLFSNGTVFSQEGLLKPFGLWKEYNFNAQQLADGTSDDLENPLADGVSNLEKYAFGISVFQNGINYLPGFGMADDHLTLSYRFAPGITDVSYVVEVTGDLTAAWESGPNAIEQVSSIQNDDFYTRTVTVRDKTAQSSSVSQRFMRLRLVRLTTDADNDGMNDDLELKYFGTIFESAGGDFDGDGILNGTEFTSGSDPSDFYNGVTPTLTIVSGDQQTGLRGAYLSQPLVLSVSGQSGPLSDAPVHFSVPAGSGSLDSRDAHTNSLGQVQTRFQMPSAANGAIVIQASAGKPPNQAVASFTVNVLNPPTGPGGVVVVNNPDGSIDMSWSDLSSDEDSFVIRLRNQDGEWEVIGAVPANRTSVHINPDRTIAP